MEKKKRVEKSTSKNRLSRMRFKDFANLLIIVGIIGYIFYIIGKRKLAEYLLKDNAVQAKAVIIDVKNALVNSPVSHKFSYSYLFYVNGNAYKNDSKDPKLNLGDSIDVEYVKNWPSLNRPIANSH